MSCAEYSESETCDTQACAQACQSTATSSSSGGSIGPSSVCSGSAASCANGESLESCQNLGANGQCTSAYFQVGTQTFACVSCTDLTSCQQ